MSFGQICNSASNAQTVYACTVLPFQQGRPSAGAGLVLFEGGSYASTRPWPTRLFSQRPLPYRQGTMNVHRPTSPFCWTIYNGEAEWRIGLFSL